MSSKKLNILIALSIIVLIFSVAMIGHHYLTLSNEKQVFEALKTRIESNTVGEVTDNGSTSKPTIKHLTDEARFLRGLESLSKVNPDLIAWITIDQSAIDYPIMQTANRPNYYLHRDFNLKYSLSGTPYVDYKYDLTDVQSNAIVYGHNMKDGSMFSELESYARSDFEPAIHAINLYQTNGIARHFKIVAVVETEVYKKMPYDFYALPKMSESDKLTAYYEAIEKMATFKVSREALNAPGSLLVLSTCASDHPHKRVLVIAKETP